MTDNKTELATAPANPLTIIQTATESGASPENLEKLMELQERYEANNARKLFNRALVKFQSECPIVYKGRTARNYNWASIDDINRIVGPVMESNDLAVSFSQSETETTLTVVCRVMHIEGHSEETPFTIPKDAPIQNKQGQSVTSLAQAQASTNSYARRYAWCNAMNIIVGDQDDDAKAKDQPVQYVTAEQAQELRRMSGEAGADIEALLVHYKAGSFETIPLVFYPKAKGILEVRIASKKEEGAE